jgi:hypothetical protein
VITLASFSKPEEAHLFRMRLEAVGIPAFVQDEHMIQLDWLYSNAIGGVRVQVGEGDFEDAREFLASDTPQPTPEAEGLSCPSCGSQNTTLDEFPRRVAFFSLMIFQFPLLIWRPCWRCAPCGTVFRAPRVRKPSPEALSAEWQTEDR